MMRRGFNNVVRRVSSGSDAAATSFLAQLQKKGKTISSPADLDAALSEDPKLAAQFKELDAALQRELAGLRARPAGPPASVAPVKVALTGAAGNIGYAALFRIASGQLLGPDVPVDLRLLDLPAAEGTLKGVEMELHDCAFPLLRRLSSTSKPEEAFDGVEIALLVGAKPRGKGMTRGDLLKENGAIFKVQGQALNAAANREKLRAVVVGNPANTNAWIASQFAPDISPTQFSALTRLDHNRGIAQLSQKLNVPVELIERFCIWGNHSSTQVPDVSHVQVGGKWAKDLLKDDKEWLSKTFEPVVRERGAAIIAARGASSAASAANATIEHINHWVNGTDGAWTSMAVWSDGSYGAEKGVYYSFPVVCANGGYSIVQNVPIDKPTAAAMEASNQELIKERDEVAASLGIKIPSIKDHFTKWKSEFEKSGKLPHFYPPTL